MTLSTFPSSRSLFLSLFCLCQAFAVALLPMRGVAAPTPDDSLGGRMQAELDGRTVSFPVLKTDIDADVQGDLATVTVTQTFANPSDRPVHARYLFPLNQDAAVYAMTLRVGDELVRARIQEAAEAKATFAAAKQEGKSAALLEQHRPNMFTQSVANLMPELPITVTVRYVQPVPKLDGAYELVIPTVVGPRFEPPRAEDAGPVAPSDAGVFIDDGGDAPAATGTWRLDALPAYPPVAGLDIPAGIEPDRLSITVTLDGGVPVQVVSSPTHALDVTAPNERMRRISLAAGRVIDNKDFVLRYQLAGGATQAGLLAHADSRGGFFSLLLEPPALPQADQIVRREMVFLLDTSGSMSGQPMAASKTFMVRALQDLRPTDSFRVLRFSDDTSELASAPLPATPANIRHGIAYVQGLYGSGGTMMTRGIARALGPPVEDGVLRMVVFLTDGYIGNEAEVLGLVNQLLNGARLFAFGVGSAVNRYLLDEIGRAGRGFTRYVDPVEDARAVAADLAERLRTPVLTDIRIDWGGLDPTDVTPAPSPDLFAGDSVRVQGRYAKGGTYTIRVQGRTGDHQASLPLQITLPLPGTADPVVGLGDAIDPAGDNPVALTWARSAIKAQMRLLTLPQDRRPWAASDATIRQRVTQLGLDFSLVSRWTSFVAVTERLTNPNPAGTPTAAVPLPQVDGVSSLAYGDPATRVALTVPNQGAPAAPASNFTGNAAPEPGIVASLLLLVCVFGWLVYRRRKHPAMVPAS